MSRYVLVRKRKKAKRSKLVVVVAVVLVCAIVCLYALYVRSMSPTIKIIAKAEVESQLNVAIHNAVIEVFGQYAYCDFVTIEQDSQQNVLLVKSNAQQINDLSLALATTVQNAISQLAEREIAIALGTLSGIPLLAEKGPNLYVYLQPVGKTQCWLQSTFQSAGINQTLHRIYVNVQTQIDLVVPSEHYVIQNDLPVLLCESIIVGKVPQTYLQGGFLPL